MYTDDDIQYALEMTRVLHEPDRRIDTFGTTTFNFHLVSELMDKANEVRVRQGVVHAERPRILKPDPYEDFNFEGFGEQAQAFSEWFKRHVQRGGLALLKYGFSFRRDSVTEEIIHDSFQTVCDRVVTRVNESSNPLNAVICGVDDTWEISLLRFTVEMIEKSQGINIFDFKRRGLL